MVLRGVLDSWPALAKWQDLSYLSQASPQLLAHHHRLAGGLRPALSAILGARLQDCWGVLSLAYNSCHSSLLEPGGLLIT